MDEILGWHNGKYTFGDTSANELREKWAGWMQHGVTERREKIEEISARLNSGKVKDDKKQKVEKELDDLREEQKSIIKLQNDGFFNENHSIEDWKKLDIFTRTDDYKDVQGGENGDKSKKDPVKRIQKSLDELKKGSLDNIQTDQPKIAQALRNQRNGMEFEKVENVAKDENLLDENGKIDYNKNKSNFLKQNIKDEKEKGNLIDSDEKERKRIAEAKKELKIHDDRVKELDGIPIGPHFKDQIENSKLPDRKPSDNQEDDKDVEQKPYLPPKKKDEKKKKEDEKKKDEDEKEKNENKKSLGDRLKDFWDASSTIRKWSIRLSVVLLLLSLFFQLIYGLVVVLTAYCDTDGTYWSQMRDELGLEKDAHVTDILVGATDFDTAKMAGFDEEQTSELISKASDRLSGDAGEKYKNEANEKEFVKMGLNIMVRSYFLQGNGASNEFVKMLNLHTENETSRVISELENKKNRSEKDNQELENLKKIKNEKKATEKYNFLSDPLTIAINIFVETAYAAELISLAFDVVSLGISLFVPGGLVVTGPLSLIKTLFTQTSRKLLFDGVKKIFKEFLEAGFKGGLKAIMKTAFKNIAKNWKKIATSILTKAAIYAIGLLSAVGHFVGGWLLSTDFIKENLTNGEKFLLKKIGNDFIVNWGADNPQWKSVLDAVCNGFSVKAQAEGAGCGAVLGGPVCIEKQLAGKSDSDTITLYNSKDNPTPIKVSTIKEIIKYGNEAKVPTEVINFVILIHPTESVGAVWNAKGVLNNGNLCLGIAQLCQGKDGGYSYENWTKQALGSTPSPEEFLNSPVMQMKAIYAGYKDKLSTLDSSLTESKKVAAIAGKWLGAGCDQNGTCTGAYASAAEKNFQLISCKGGEPTDPTQPSAGACQGGTPIGSGELSVPFTKESSPKYNCTYGQSATCIINNQKSPYGYGAHHGIDIGVPDGSVVVAPADGQVVSDAPDNSAFCSSGRKGGQRRLMLKHLDKNGKEFYTAYLHLVNTNYIGVNTSVKKGQPLGNIEQTCGHLHFEVGNSTNLFGGGGNVDPCTVLSCPALGGAFE